MSAAKPSASNEIVIFAGSSRRRRTGALRDHPPTARDGNRRRAGLRERRHAGAEPRAGVSGRMHPAPFITLRDPSI
jgi:hypothetical protein